MIEIHSNQTKVRPLESKLLTPRDHITRLNDWKLTHHKHFHIQLLHQCLIRKDKNTLHKHNLPRFHHRNLFGPHMSAKIIIWNIHGLVLFQIFDMLYQQMGVEGIGVIKIVLGSLFER